MFLCKFVEKNLAAYAGNETNFVKNFIIKEHIHSCSLCKTKLESITDVKLPPPPDLKAMKEQVKSQVQDFEKKAR